MCTDTNLSETLLAKLEQGIEDSPEVTQHASRFGHNAEDDTEVDDSFSGNERNHLFISQAGKKFDDVSPLSGLDCLEDTRSSVLFDYDRDGWLDIALVNCNAPSFGLFRNSLAANPAAAERGNNIIAVQLVGGATPSGGKGFAPRDGYGGKVFVKSGDKTYMRESRAGEGFASQNSRTLFIGIGKNDYAEDVTIRWPSGKTQNLQSVAAGTLLTCYENPADSPDGSGFASEPYLRNSADDLLATGVANATKKPVLELTGAESEAPLRMLTTMATWCEVCRGELPQLAQLREEFGQDKLGMYAVPIDAEDDVAKLNKYREQYHPAYNLLAELPLMQRQQVQDVIKEQLGTETLPATLILNSSGEVIATFAGVPSVSAVRELLTSPRP